MDIVRVGRVVEECLYQDWGSRKALAGLLAPVVAPGPTLGVAVF